MKTYRFLYPEDPFNKGKPDSDFASEMDWLVSAGYACSTLAGEPGDLLKSTPAIKPGDTVIYRGWMLRVPLYESLADWVATANAQLLTLPPAYAHCHLLPSWYAELIDLTAPTMIFPASSHLMTDLQKLKLPWKGCFVKDYVKSLTTSRGSIAGSTNEVVEIAALLKQYRGTLEGGLCLRELMEFEPGTEQRFFVVKGVAYAAEGAVPEIVRTVASRVMAPFYSVDIAQTRTGALQVVELGDGQVSDRKHWPLEVFCKEILSRLAKN